MYAVIKDGIKMGNMNAVIITIARFFGIVAMYKM